MEVDININYKGFFADFWQPVINTIHSFFHRRSRKNPLQIRDLQGIAGKFIIIRQKAAKACRFTEHLLKMDLCRENALLFFGDICPLTEGIYLKTRTL